jgi:hypothetical protein
MISDIFHKYIFKNDTRLSGSILSLIVVNQAISEKNIVIFFLSPSSFTVQLEVNISLTISEETYSESAFESNFLFLSSFIYFKTEETKNDKNKTDKNCSGKNGRI